MHKLMFNNDCGSAQKNSQVFTVDNEGAADDWVSANERNARISGVDHGISVGVGDDVAQITDVAEVPSRISVTHLQWTEQANFNVTG